MSCIQRSGHAYFTGLSLRYRIGGSIKDVDGGCGPRACSSAGSSRPHVVVVP